MYFPILAHDTLWKQNHNILTYGSWMFRAHPSPLSYPDTSPLILKAPESSLPCRCVYMILVSILPHILCSRSCFSSRNLTPDRALTDLPPNKLSLSFSVQVGHSSHAQKPHPSPLWLSFWACSLVAYYFLTLQHYAVCVWGGAGGREQYLSYSSLWYQCWRMEEVNAKEVLKGTLENRYFIQLIVVYSYKFLWGKKRALNSLELELQATSQCLLFIKYCQ